MTVGKATQSRLQIGLAVAGLIPALRLLQPVLPGLGSGQALTAQTVEHMAQRSGSWALYFLLLSLSITPLRRGLRAAWLVRFRRTLGLLSFVYAGLHLGIWLVDRARDPLPRLGESLLADLGKRPYIALGALAFLCLLPLALTSTQGMIRRLGRRWQRLHRLVYGAALLSVLHFTWQAKQDAWRAYLCAAIWLLWMGLRLVYWARDLRRAWLEDSDGG